MEETFIEPLLASVRALHFIATLSVGGAMAFLVLVLSPGQTPFEGLTALEARVMRLVWASLVVAVISGAIWLGLEAQAMSGRPFAALVSEGILKITLTSTQFGHVAVARLVVAAAIAVCLLARRRAAPPFRTVLDVVTVILGAAFAAGIAWSGHAAATEGAAGLVHLSSDIAHVLAATAWLGALLPLALYLNAANGGDRPLASTIPTVVGRFSSMGIACVAVLLVSGIVNTWVLAGTIPALLGTPYGNWLLLKILLFLAMVGVAAINRARLTPRLSRATSGANARSRRAAADRLRRNALVEMSLGICIVVIVGGLGTLPPGLHTEPVWPLPFRLPMEDPQLEPEIVNRIALLVLGVAAIFGSLALRGSLREFKYPIIAIGLVIVFDEVIQLGTVAVEAYPTSFASSPTGYTADSIVAGRRLFATNCALCHGDTGKGDGALAKTLQIPPADLTAEHIYGHLDGELFWWITSGIDDVMPAFETRLDARQRWNLIDFVHANADAARFMAGTADPRPQYIRAPDFAAQCEDGSTLTLRQIEGRISRLVFANGQGERPLAADNALGSDVVTVLVADGRPPRRPFCVASGSQVAAAYGQYLGLESAPEGSEFLIDAKGSLRAAWVPDILANNGSDWRDPSVLRAEVERIRRTPVARTVAAHTHTH